VRSLRRTHPIPSHGKGRTRVHPENAEQNQARRVVANPEGQQPPKDEIHSERDGERTRREFERHTACREAAEDAERHEHGSDEQRATHPEPHCAPRKRSDDAGAQPLTCHANANQRRHLPGIDGDDADEEQRLRHDGQRVADVECARDQFVGDETEEPIGCRRGRERADPERVEEVRDKPSAASSIDTRITFVALHGYP
jgi:hypothetical protein